ncbi:MAG: chemotaxis protein CheW [Deltaproteobacteria bacterium]|nr:MAG: chemotaxis protein CheW [Deltaproteobacteria bacterium]
MPRAVICLHGGNRYALPLSVVRRVTEMVFVSRVPRAPPALLGVMSQQGRVAALIERGPLVGLKARPARPEGKVVMLQRPRGDVGLYVSEVAGIEEIPAEARELKEPSGAVLAQVDSAEGPVKLIDPEQLQRAIDNLVEA